MNDIQSYLTNYTAPAAGYTYGTLKDDPGDGTGSGIIVKTHNDFLYAFYTPINKYLGAVSDTDETETASDFTDAMERMAGVQNENVATWLNGTTYAQFDHVMYLGLQFVSLVAGNVGNDPIDTPAKWLPCFNRDDAMVKYRNGEDIKGGFEGLHDVRDALYLQYYEFGKFNYGGDGGRNFQAYGVHLDGTQITGDATLVAIFDVGGPDEYPHLDIIAPDIVGVRTLMDAQGRVARVTDAAGPAVVVGAVQADAMQRITGEAFGDGGSTTGVKITTISSGAWPAGTSAGALTAVQTNTGTGTNSATGGAGYIEFDSDDSTSPNAAKTDDVETRMANYAIGLPSVLVMLEI